MQQDINELLQAIYDDYQKPLRILTLHYGVPSKDVDDIVQESIISYYEHYPLDAPPNYKKGMLATIARNKSIDYFRKNNREKLILDADNFVESEEMIFRYGDNLMDQVICDELFRDVQDAVSALSKDLNAAAKLHLIYQIPQKETAEILKITPVACRGRISRARKILRE